MVAIKGTLSLSASGALTVANEQLPLWNEDQHNGEPGESSVRYESDRCPLKPGTDVVLNGHAHTPHSRPAEQLDVKLQVGSPQQVVRVIGDRLYFRSLGRWSISDIAPFSSMPLVYERAFGGADETAMACAAQGFRRGYAPANEDLLWTNSDDGQRAALSVAAPEKSQKTCLPPSTSTCAP